MNRSSVSGRVGASESDFGAILLAGRVVEGDFGAGDLAGVVQVPVPGLSVGAAGGVGAADADDAVKGHVLHHLGVLRAQDEVLVLGDNVANADAVGDPVAVDGLATSGEGSRVNTGSVSETIGGAGLVEEGAGLGGIKELAASAGGTSSLGDEHVKGSSVENNIPEQG